MVLVLILYLSYDNVLLEGFFLWHLYSLGCFDCCRKALYIQFGSWGVYIDRYKHHHQVGYLQSTYDTGSLFLYHGLCSLPLQSDGVTWPTGVTQLCCLGCTVVAIASGVWPAFQWSWGSTQCLGDRLGNTNVIVGSSNLLNFFLLWFRKIDGNFSVLK